jgi:hypothetical protein
MSATPHHGCTVEDRRRSDLITKEVLTVEARAARVPRRGGPEGREPLVSKARLAFPATRPPR